MTKQAELLAFLFQGRTGPLSAELGSWMACSARFTAFVEMYREKIRKKLRVTPDPESLLDVRGELAVAYHLLNDRRLTLGYEPYASAKKRGPDFAVTYRANLVFNIEVARMRVEQSAGEGISFPRNEERIQRILLAKLGQMQPGMANLLVIHTREELAQSIDLGKLMQAVKTKAEHKDPSFYAVSAYANPADFYKDFLHLNGILLWASGVQVWVNKPARPELAGKALRLVSALLSSAGHSPER